LSFPLICVHSLIIGSGAAGLNAALQLHANEIKDLLIITEGLEMGTSINTGSDKQTYYKLATCGSQPDSVLAVAKALFGGGSMHGDLALVEASYSTRAFMNLVNLGVPFPRDSFGQFVGYRTDHDLRQRATSAGPYTSKEMCNCLIREVRQRNIAICEKRMAVALLTLENEDENRIAGAIVLDWERANKTATKWFSCLEIYCAENVIFAVGGPGGLYKTSVYPKVQSGAIGLAFMAGAEAHNLQESQYGLSSVKFRWNVSGSYMQAIPRFFSSPFEGQGEERDFLRDYFESEGEMNSAIFLKGYQWPFDTTKIVQGSSIIDVLVYIETVVNQRRVWLDFRQNSVFFRVDQLCSEAQDYLKRSHANLQRPIERLKAMNPDAIALYKRNNIDLAAEPLEISVCAQHNNGGLAGDLWWESTNLRHFFPIGEVNGSHGVTRPGGAALNSGQVGGFRAAEYIANRYRKFTLNITRFKAIARKEILTLYASWEQPGQKPFDWNAEKEDFQRRMSSAGGHIRRLDSLRDAVKEAWNQWARLTTNKYNFPNISELREAINARQLCFSHAIYLEAILFAVESGLGSRGSCMVLDADGIQAHPKLGKEWRFATENTRFRSMVLKTSFGKDLKVVNQWVKRRAIPRTDTWFETTWAAFRKGEIYSHKKSTI